MSVPKGTRIHVEFDAVVEEAQVNSERSATYLVRSEKTGSFHYVFIHDDFTEDEWRDAKVIAPPVVPRFWPPIQGDLWTTRVGVTYYVYFDDDTRKLTLMADGLGYCKYLVEDQPATLGWKLVHRNGVGVDNG